MFSEKSAAESASVDAAKAYEIETDVARVTGLWDFFQECASCGHAGVVLDNYYPIIFHNRLTDMNRSTPTLMRLHFPHSTNELREFFFGRMGIVKIEPGTTVNWINYEKLDKASNRYVLRGDPLPEPIDAHVIVPENDLLHTFPDGASFLGPYISNMGALPVFSSKVWAHYFARLHGILGAPEENVDFERLGNGFVLKRVDLQEFLDTTAARDWPFVDIGLNPNCHRFRQGWFFKKDDTWFLETISGVWQIETDGFVHRPDVRPYKGHLGQLADPSLLWFGVATVIERPFKRLLGADRAPLPEDDARALLESELAEPFQPQPIDSEASIPTDAFVIDAFDKVTGERFALSAFDIASRDLGFLVFPDAIAAVRFLIHELLPGDEQVRADGYRLCHGGGSAGSQDPDRESRATSNIVIALKKTLVDALTTGYRPEHGLHIGRLIRDATATVEITEIGYFGDLLYYGTSDGRPIEDRIDREDLEDTEAEQAAARAIKKLGAAKKKITEQFTLSSAIVSQLRKPLGRAYDMLAPESRVIAATAIEEFNRTGMRPGYDYAGISMKVCKLVERELIIRVFRPWRIAVRKKLGGERLSVLQQELAAPTADRTDQVLMQWLQKQSKIDLGSMRYCLRNAGGEVQSTPPRRLLAEYLDELPGGQWLTSEQFESALVDISTKYRNGGVHEHLVTFETCREAVDRILLGPQPLLQRLMEATAGRNDA